MRPSSPVWRSIWLTAAAWALLCQPVATLPAQITGDTQTESTQRSDQATPGEAVDPDLLLAHVIDRGDYEDRLRAMWLGEVIANWTGRTTEGCCCPGCPGGGDFLTDADWGGQTPGGKTIEFILDQDPWLADDDTDIEYIYQYLMESHGPELTAEQIRAGWMVHINDFIWVSNARARALMDRGVAPPETSLGCGNIHSLRIDAQLTTEMFGVYCPGRPADALALAQLPIRTTAEGYAAHAAQAFVVMYAWATLVPDDLSGVERSLWLIERAREILPDTSKVSDVLDFVTAWYLSHPDDPWEDCRDAIYSRYQLNDDQHGFLYRGWTESTVNFATAIMALLYGEGDYRRTIQIATLSGWDSDNPAATLGGLLGLMLGYDDLVAQFPGQSLSDRYLVSNTRDGIEDRLPDDLDAEDTFALLAGRQLLVADQAIAALGGRLDPVRNRWVIPVESVADLWQRNPLQTLTAASANNQVRSQGGTVTAASSVDSAPPPHDYYGSPWPSNIANGYELNFTGIEFPARLKFYSTQNAGALPGDWQTLTVSYDREVTVAVVRFIEGDHFDEPAARGGNFTDCYVELLQDGAWSEPAGVVLSEALDADRPFQIIDFVLPESVPASGVRIVGRVDNPDAFVTIAELDALSEPVSR
jgi:ADP-ribosylglycohydrolase